MTPAVLIPGTLCDARVFGPMAEGLPFDASFAPFIAHSKVDQAAEAVLATAPGRFVAIGFSLGGFVTLELMRRAPERLLGAVLIGSSPYALQPRAADARRAEVELARHKGVEAFIEEVWPRYVAPARLLDRGLRDLVTDMARAVGVACFEQQAELAITRRDSVELVRTSRTALLALHGELDAMSPLERARPFGEGPAGRLVSLPGVGHFVPLEAPQQAAAVIGTWTEELALCS